MRKYILVAVGLFIVGVIAGCGGGGTTSATTLPANVPAKIFPINVVDTKFSITDGSGHTFKILPFKNNSTLTWGPADTNKGTWKINNGNDLELTLTDTSTSKTTIQTLRFIQQEYSNPDQPGSDPNHPDYWLVYDLGTKLNSRLYLNQIPTNYNPKIMGGAILGGAPLTSAVTVSTFAGRLPGAFGFTNASSAFQNATTARRAQFNQPIDITTPDGSTYYVLDYVNNVIRKINSNGNVSTLDCTDSSTGAAVPLITPQGITTDGTSLYVAETGNHVIRQIIIDPSILLPGSKGNTSIIAGKATFAGAIDGDGLTAAQFNSPTGITTDGTNLYVADSGNHIIRKIQIRTKQVTTLAGLARTIGTADGTFTDARFNVPLRLTTDGSKLYVTDLNNRTIRSVQIATGEVVTIAGNASAPAAQSNNKGTSALFYHPMGITTDGTSLYVTDFNNIILPKPGAALTDANMFNNLIRKIVINPSSNDYLQVTAIAGGKSYPEVALEGIGLDARFAAPRGVVWDGKSLLVANGTYSFTTDGVTINNLTSAFNVIFKVDSAL